MEAQEAVECTLNAVGLAINLAIFFYVVYQLQKLNYVAKCLNILSIISLMFFIIIPLFIIIKWTYFPKIQNAKELEGVTLTYFVWLNVSRQSLYVLLAYRLYFNFARTTFALSFSAMLTIVITFASVQFVNLSLILFGPSSIYYVMIGIFYALEILYNICYSYAFIRRLIAILQNHSLIRHDAIMDNYGILNDELFNLAVRSFLISLLTTTASVTLCLISLFLNYYKHTLIGDASMGVDAVINCMAILLYYEFGSKVYNILCCVCHKQLQYASMRYLFGVKSKNINNNNNTSASTSTSTTQIQI